MVILNKDVAKYVKIVAESLNANNKLQLLSIEDIVSLNEPIENTTAVIDIEPVIVQESNIEDLIDKPIILRNLHDLPHKDKH